MCYGIYDSMLMISIICDDVMLFCFKMIRIYMVQICDINITQHAF